MSGSTVTNAAAREVGHVRAKKTMTEPLSEQEFCRCPGDTRIARDGTCTACGKDASGYYALAHRCVDLRATVAKLTEERDGLRKRVESLNETCAAYKEQTKELLARLVDESGRRIQPATTSNAPPVPERQDDRICVVWAEEPGVPVGLQKTEGSIVVAVGATVSHVAYYRAQRLSKSLQQFLGQESNEDLTRERDQLRAQLAERDAATARVAELEAQVRYDAQLLRQNTTTVEELNSLRAQLAERDAMVAEAKGLLAVAQSTFGGHKSRDWCERRDALLTNTAQAAADYEARIRAPLEAQVAALMSYVRWLDNHGSLEIEADDAETMLERYSVAEIKYKDEQQTRFMQGNTAAAAEAHDAGVRRRATAAVKSVRDEAVKLADHHCVVQVLRWLDRAIAALSTAGKEET